MREIKPRHIGEKKMEVVHTVIKSLILSCSHPQINFVYVATKILAIVSFQWVYWRYKLFPITFLRCKRCCCLWQIGNVVLSILSLAFYVGAGYLLSWNQPKNETMGIMCTFFSVFFLYSRNFLVDFLCSMYAFELERDFRKWAITKTYEWLMKACAIEVFNSLFEKKLMSPEKIIILLWWEFSPVKNVHSLSLFVLMEITTMFYYPNHVDNLSSAFAMVYFVLILYYLLVFKSNRWESVIVWVYYVVFVYGGDPSIQYMVVSVYEVVKWAVFKFLIQIEPKSKRKVPVYHQYAPYVLIFVRMMIHGW